MRQDIKNKELQERQKYVPASVKVFNVTAQKVLCVSGDGTQQYENETPDWF